MIVKRFSKKSEIDEKIQRLEELEEKQRQEKLNAIDKQYKTGLAGGITAMGVGGLATWSGYDAARFQKSKQKALAEAYKDMSPKSIRLLKVAGPTAIGLGGLLTAASAVGHSKTKKKLKKKEDDHSEKKK